MQLPKDIGPLIYLVGVWSGDKGTDIAPAADGGEENNPYYETLHVTEAGDLDNAEIQEIGIVHYTQIVRRKSNDEVFHHQTGYFMWDKKTDKIMFSLAIPRGVCVLAQGKYTLEGNRFHLEVASDSENPNFGVLEQVFMAKKASTKKFSLELSVKNGTLEYSETTLVDIYGKEFSHTDSNQLTKLP